MSQDNYPRPFVDTEAEGIPGYADDDSTAKDDVETGRSADGPAPVQLPADAPLASDRYGTTAAEQRHGEPLDYKLSQETVDPALAGVGEATSGAGEEAEGQPPEWSEPGGKVGRLIEPDAGGGIDEEKEAVATDVGASGGGATMEELAMHEVEEPEET